MFLALLLKLLELKMAEQWLRLLNNKLEFLQCLVSKHVFSLTGETNENCEAA